MSQAVRRAIDDAALLEHVWQKVRNGFKDTAMLDVLLSINQRLGEVLTLIEDNQKENTSDTNP